MQDFCAFRQMLQFSARFFCKCKNVAVKNGKEYFIQVAYSVVDQKAYDREFSAFDGLDYKNQKILITTDNFDYSTSMVKHISLSKFLENEEEL